MKRLADIARDLHQDLEHLRVLEACGRFKAKAPGMYDPSEVRAAACGGERLPDGLAQWEQVRRVLAFFGAARTAHARNVRSEAAAYILKGYTAETISDAARRLGISRKHFSDVVGRLRNVTLLGDEV